MKESITDSVRKEHGPHRPSRLFLLRVWLETQNECHGPEDLTGKVQDPVSGQVQYFHGGAGLVRILLRLLTKEAGRPHKHPEDGQL